MRATETSGFSIIGAYECMLASLLNSMKVRQQKKSIMFLGREHLQILDVNRGYGPERGHPGRSLSVSRGCGDDHTAHRVPLLLRHGSPRSSERFMGMFRRMVTIGVVGMVWLMDWEARGADRSARSQRMPTMRPSASGTNATNLSGLAAFNIISERNIFNPNRGPRSSGTVGDAPPPKTLKVESVSLVGTLIHGKGMIAFFDGSSDSLKQAVRVSDTIAGCKVTAVVPDAVWLEMAGKEVEMKVGMQLRREDEGEWKLSDKAEAASKSGAGSGGSSGKSSGEDSGGGADEDDVVKKMMQRREKENNK